MKYWALPLLLLASSAGAQDNLVQMYSYPTHDSCADWTLERNNPERYGQRLQAWILGYVSASNVYGTKGGDIAGGGNGSALLAWVDNYCTANPLDRMPTVAIFLVRELQKRAGESQ